MTGASDLQIRKLVTPPQPREFEIVKADHRAILFCRRSCDYYPRNGDGRRQFCRSQSNESFWSFPELYRDFQLLP